MERIKSDYYTFYEILNKAPLIELFFRIEKYFNPNHINRINNELYEFHGWG
jgi:hypothetical protein